MSFEAFAACRFYVEIDKDKQAVFTEVSGLQIETEVFEYQEGGLNHTILRLPGPSKVGNVTLRRGLAASNEFYLWYLEILRKDGPRLRKNVSIIAYDTAGRELMRWNLLNAWPVRWTAPQFDASGQGAAIESVELAHEGLGDL